MSPPNAHPVPPPENPSRAQYSLLPRMEHILLPSISKLDRPLPHRPVNDRSMTESFFLDRSQVLPPTPSTSKTQKLAETPPPTPPAKDEPPTPLASWAHLSLLKNERTTLRSQLKAQQVANTEARQSVSALRRLAFRLAVNISVKEKRIASTARSLAQSRKKEYLSTRDADRRIETLTKCWKEEERRNQEIMASLERAALLTLQLPRAAAAHSKRPNTPSPLSPPPSPPSHNSSRAYQRPITPTSPTRSSSSSVSPGTRRQSFGPLEIGGPNDRLIRAKRDFDHALLVCRSRIEALQSDTLRSKESAKILEITRNGLEEEIHGYRSRVSALEQSKAAVEEILFATQSKLDDSVKSATELRTDLELKKQEIAELEKNSRQDAEKIKVLEASNALLENQIENCTAQIQELEEYTAGLKDDVKVIQSRLDAAEHREANLLQKVAENESQRAKVENKFNQQQAKIATLEQASSFFEGQIDEYQLKMAAFEGEVAWLTDGLKNAEQLKDRVEGELAAARYAFSEVDSSFRSVSETNLSLQMELKDIRASKCCLEEELTATKEKLVSETDLCSELKTEVISLQRLQEKMQSDVENAHVRIALFEEQNPELQKELESLRAEKTLLEEHLHEAQKSGSQLGQELQAAQEKLLCVQELMTELQSKLGQSERARAELSDEVRDVRHSRAFVEEQLCGVLASKVQLEEGLAQTKSRLHHAESEGTRLKKKLSIADVEINSLRRTNAELEQSERRLSARLANAEKELNAVRRANTELESFLDKAENDTTIAEASLDDAVKRIEAFVDESDARIQASKNARMQYKRRLSSKDKELDSLKGENTELHHQLEQKDQDIQSLKSNESRLQEQLQLREARIQELQKSRSDFAAGMDAIEEELRTLRESKEAFEEVVKSLQEKTAHLAVLSEGDQRGSQEGASSVASHETHGFVQSPAIQHILMTGAESHGRASLRTKSHQRHSVESTAGGVEAWAREVERVRMLRNETAIQLKGMKRVKASLKKSLKASENELEKLEKKSKPKKHHQFFSRRLASNPSIASIKSSPMRPSTAMSRHDEVVVDSIEPATPDQARMLSPRPSTAKSIKLSKSPKLRDLSPFDPQKRRFGDSVRNMFRRRASAKRDQSLAVPAEEHDTRRPGTAAPPL